MTDIRVGDVVVIDNHKYVVLEVRDGRAYDLIRALKVDSYDDFYVGIYSTDPKHYEHKCMKPLKTDVHLQIVEDIMSQIKNAKVMEDK